MVRFIIPDVTVCLSKVIYYLHSNMVRFIIQILEMAWEICSVNLHSNMVRFIITAVVVPAIGTAIFTFQYG